MSPQRSQSMLLFSKGVCEFSSKQFRKILSTFLFHQTFPTFYSTQIIELHSCRRSQRLKYFESFSFLPEQIAPMMTRILWRGGPLMCCGLYIRRASVWSNFPQNVRINKILMQRQKCSLLLLLFQTVRWQIVSD